MFHLMIVLLCVLARAFQESLSSLMDSVSAAAIDHGGFRQRLVNQEDVESAELCLSADECRRLKLQKPGGKYTILTKESDAAMP